jgi:phosphoglycolate phosphatase
VFFLLPLDAVIFDLDGTLTDSKEGIFACVQYALEKMGHVVPPPETLRRFIGPPLAESFIRYCGMTEEQLPDWMK